MLLRLAKPKRNEAEICTGTGKRNKNNPMSRIGYKGSSKTNVLMHNI